MTWHQYDHSIQNSSIKFSLSQKMIGKFGTTSSIQRLALDSWSNEEELLDSIKSHESIFADYLLESHSNFLFGDGTWECSTCKAQELRVSLWKMPIEGITMPATSELLSLHPWEDPCINIRRSILITTRTWLDGSQDPFHTTGGIPYFGSETRVKSKRGPLQVVEMGSRISTLKKCVEMVGWLKYSPQVKELLETLLKEKADLDLKSVIDNTASNYSGSVSHRLPVESLRKGGMINTMINFNSFLNIISDTALYFAKSGNDYNLCFQDIFLAATSRIQHICHMTNRTFPPKIGVNMTCNKCIFLLQEDKFTMRSHEYQGIPIFEKISQLTFKDLSSSSTIISESENLLISFSFNVGRQFYLYKRSIDKKVDALQHDVRALEDKYTAPFVNLSELVIVNVEALLAGFLIYSSLYEPSKRLNMRLDYSEICLSKTLTIYDIMIDSLV